MAPSGSPNVHVTTLNLGGTAKQVRPSGCSSYASDMSSLARRGDGTRAALSLDGHDFAGSSAPAPAHGSLPSRTAASAVRSSRCCAFTVATSEVASATTTAIPTAPDSRLGATRRDQVGVRKGLDVDLGQTGEHQGGDHDQERVEGPSLRRSGHLAERDGGDDDERPVPEIDRIGDVTQPLHTRQQVQRVRL